MPDQMRGRLMNRKSDDNHIFGDEHGFGSSKNANGSQQAAGSKHAGVRNHSQNMERVQRLIDSLADFAAEEIRQDLCGGDGSADYDQSPARQSRQGKNRSNLYAHYDRPAPPRLLIEGKLDRPSPPQVSLELLQKVDARLGTIAVSTAYGVAINAYPAVQCLRAPHAGFINTGDLPAHSASAKISPRQTDADSHFESNSSRSTPQSGNNQLAAVRINKLLAEALNEGQRRSPDRMFCNIKDVIKIVDFSRFCEKKDVPPQAPPPPSGTVRARYLVQPGDTPAKIAKLFFGDPRFADLIITINRVNTFYEQSHSGWHPRLHDGTEICLPSEEEREIYGRNYFKKKGNDFFSKFGNFANQSKAKCAQVLGNSLTADFSRPASQEPDAPVFLRGMRFPANQSPLASSVQEFNANHSSNLNKPISAQPLPKINKPQCQPVKWNTSDDQKAPSNHMFAAPNVPSLRRAAFFLSDSSLINQIAELKDQNVQVHPPNAELPQEQPIADVISFDPDTSGNDNPLQRILSQVRFSGCRAALNLAQFERSAPTAERRIYITLPGETLYTVAAKDPCLRDANAWRLLATLNNLSGDCDVNGLPVAALVCGQQLILPTEEEAAQYRMLTKLSQATDQAQTIKADKTSFSEMLSLRTEETAEKFTSYQLASNSRILVRKDYLGSTNFCVKLQTSIANIWFTLVTYESSSSRRTIRHIYSQQGTVSTFELDLPLTVARQMAEEDLKRNWTIYLNAYLAISCEAEKRDKTRI